uniref:Putative DNA recombination protein n=1 Tax=viral metagenome TaxID=1070528 RepID=A0A6M3LZS4_9ZZZZ
MTEQTTAVAKATGVALLKQSLFAEATKQQFENVLNREAGAFMASVLDLYQSDTALQKCDPISVIRECMKAAVLKLPIVKSLGFAYIIPYGNTAQFQMGYRGYIQLAMRTGQFKYLNAGVVYEGMKVIKDLLSGNVRIEGEAKNDKAIGYFCYMELVNGFSKAEYMTREQVEAHAKRFSKAYKQATSAWKTDFDAMALKTVLLKLHKYFPMTVEMARVIDEQQEDSFDAVVEENANKKALTMIEGEKFEEQTGYHDAAVVVDEETGEIIPDDVGKDEPPF